MDTETTFSVAWESTCSKTFPEHFIYSLKMKWIGLCLSKDTHLFLHTYTYFLQESFTAFFFKKKTIYSITPYDRVSSVQRGRKNSGLVLTLVFKYLGGG